MRHHRALHAGLGTFVFAALLSCGGGDRSGEAVSIAPERIENPDLGIAIAGLPGGYDVVANQGDRLELTREPGLPPGRAWVTLGEPVEGGINLVEIISGQRQAFEALPGGSFNGNGELVLPDGRPAYYSRGRFQEEDATQVEEFRVWSVHPVEANRLLAVFYRYPAAQDSAQRLEDVLLLVGEIEGLEGEGSAPADSGSGGSTPSGGEGDPAAGGEPASPAPGAIAPAEGGPVGS